MRKLLKNLKFEWRKNIAFNSPSPSMVCGPQTTRNHRDAIREDTDGGNRAGVYPPAQSISNNLVNFIAIFFAKGRG